MRKSRHMKKKQEKWSKPQLIIVGRGKAEEYVLAACKYSGMAGPDRPAVQACQHPAHGICATVSPS
jgi:hypothetical protein